MNRRVLLVLALVAWCASAVSLWAEPVSATVVKVKGSVQQSSDAGESTPLVTGTAVPIGKRVVVGRLSLAVYKVGEGVLIKQEPQASLSFTRLLRHHREKGNEWGVDALLQRGEIYSAIKPREGDTIDYHVSTSKIEAIAHDAVFKVSHAFSTSTVSVREGVVEILYCRNTKRTLVHAGEVFEVTDCDGLLRWFNEDESRAMSLFVAATGSGLRTDFASEFASISSFLPPAVLSPTVIGNPDEISP